MTDGIALPFVIVAGMSAAHSINEPVASTGLFVIGISAITMGIGAYYTNKSEARHFNTDLKTKEIKERKFLSNLDISEDIQNMASGEIHKEDKKWDELMQQRPSPAKSLRNGFTKAAACVIGGFIPVLPFIQFQETMPALKLSILLTLISLIVFGYIKGILTGVNGVGIAVRTTGFTFIAAACIYGVVTLINS